MDTNSDDITIHFSLQEGSPPTSLQESQHNKSFDECPQTQLTYQCPEWNPHSDTFKQQEVAIFGNINLVCDPLQVTRGQKQWFISIFDCSDVHHGSQQKMIHAT